jgi:hypothetical protein
MTSFLDDAEIEIPCENCSHITKKTIRWIKNNQKFTCICGTIINLDSEQFKTGIAEVDSSIAKLDEVFKNFGK